MNGLLLLELLVVPLAAVVAGVVVHSSNRDAELDDGSLIRQFLFVLAVAAVVFIAIARSDTVRAWFDPRHRVQTAMAGNRIHAALERHTSGDDVRLVDALTVHVRNGASIDAAFLQVRPFLHDIASQRLSSAPERVQLEWARQSLDTLAQLRAHDPAACRAAIADQALDPVTLARAFSADNTQRFQDLVVRIVESSAKGVRGSGRTQQDAAVVDPDELRREWGSMRASSAERYGPAITAMLWQPQSQRQASNEPADEVCAAGIAQIEAILERRPALAAMLVSTALAYTYAVRRCTESA